MKLVSSKNSMLVEFFLLDNSQEFMKKRVSFCGNVVSFNHILRSNYQQEVQSRLDLGYKIVDHKTETIHSDYVDAINQVHDHYN